MGCIRLEAMMATFAIRRLHDGARASLLAHLLALPLPDRWLRFGVALAPSAIAAYVDGIDFARDAILGIHDDQDLLLGAAHVAFDGGPAEVALSVVPSWRARGVASALFAAALAQTAGRGVARLCMYFLTGNTPILRIAQRFGMNVRLRGRDAEAHLEVSAQHGKQILTAGEIVP
jgi:GNAT superfamily N-acetyltransferase